MGGMAEYTIYTDGGCSGNPGPGGWAFVLLDGSERILASGSGGERETTNNKMELTAVIRAIGEALSRGALPATVRTDSKYVQNGITDWIRRWKLNGWRTAARQPVKNKELWMELDRLAAESGVRFSWVKGHAGEPYNELCDSMVRSEMEKLV